MHRTHPRETLTVGDDWEINVTVRNRNGSLLDLVAANAVIEWGLMDESRALIVAPDEVAVDLSNGVNGAVVLRVPRAKTATLTPGWRCSDLFRVTTDTWRKTLLGGAIRLEESLP